MSVIEKDESNFIGGQPLTDIKEAIEYAQPDLKSKMATCPR